MKTRVRRKQRKGGPEPAVAREEKAVDPVCGMEVGTDTDFFSFYRDRVYYFCSAEDKAQFDQRPEDYIQRDRTPDIHGAVVNEGEPYGHRNETKTDRSGLQAGGRRGQ